jgi:antitoxin (DNA-binding transcriptional repressor) of toxin-antitoxin stability system
MLCILAMRTMTVREIRLRWPEAERALARVGEIVVTRDSKPVARLLPYEAPSRTGRVRFDPVDQERWLKRFWRNRKPGPTTDELLRRDREA